MALTAELKGILNFVLPRFRLTAADSAIRKPPIALDTGLMQGSINGRAPSRALLQVAGMPIGGNLVFSAGLDARSGQLLDLSLNGDRLDAGTGSSRIGIGRLA